MRYSCQTDLSDLSEFLDVLQKFIVTKEQTDVGAIVNRFGGSDKVPWADEYPWEWDGIIGKHLRQSFLVSLMALAEQHLLHLCQSTRTILDLPIGVDSLRGRTFERFRTFLMEVAGFAAPRPHLWDGVESIYLVRNVLVHRGGHLEGAKQQARLRKFLRDAPGAAADSAFVELEAGFCEFARAKVEEFFRLLHDHYETVCDRVAAK